MRNKYTVTSWESFKGDPHQEFVKYAGRSIFKALYTILKCKAKYVKLEIRHNAYV